jgi:hypothetical protein
VSALVVVEYVSLDGVIQAPACRRDPEGVTVVATYALWTYLTIPFVLVEPGFELWELEPWEEGASTGRGSVSASPARSTPTVASRSSTSITRGLCAGTITPPRSSGAGPRQPTTPLTTRASTGWPCPMRRRVFLRRRGNRPLTAVTLIRLDIEAVRLVSGDQEE